MQLLPLSWPVLSVSFYPGLCPGLQYNRLFSKEKSHQTVSSNRAHEILDERLAAGEISEAEYKHRRQLLKDGNSC
ncbi:MAG: SHOCT domain-containing protein [Bacillota bacterium]